MNPPRKLAKRLVITDQDLKKAIEEALADPVRDLPVDRYRGARIDRQALQQHFVHATLDWTS